MDKINGHLVLLMAPSGSGKKMMVDGLGELAHQLYFAKTYTSREKRLGTEENPKYVFVARAKFEKMIADGEFVEWAEFGGNLYGTPKSEILDTLKESRIVFKEMELQGVQQIKEIVPKEHLTVIYIDAGDWEALRKRIIARAPISEEELALRKERYEEERKFKSEADVIIQNNNGQAEAAQAAFRDIIRNIIENIQ